MGYRCFKKKRMGFAGFFLVFLLVSCHKDPAASSSASQVSSLPAFSSSSSALTVNLPTNPLSASFIYGADCSMAGEIEELGGCYYNQKGEKEDLFCLLKEEGTNTLRLRLWVDPKSASSQSYGGGDNGLERDLALAKRGKEAGLKILIDFHYSDFWADPSHYASPKAWVSLSDSEKEDAIASYTETSLNAFKNAGITVDAVQLGNEINPGLAGIPSSSDAFYSLLKAGLRSAKAVFPSIKSVIHLTNVDQASSTIAFFKSILSKGVDYDVAGVSYYPYWHGSRANLQTVLNTLANDTGKSVMILETAWGFTDEATPYSQNQFSSSGYGKIGGYATSPQGQASEMNDLIDVLSRVPNQKGAGLFYWEPDWLPVKGAGWASEAGQYYNEHGTDGLTGESDESRLQGWANQAWFSYTGVALPSIGLYKAVQTLESNRS